MTPSGLFLLENFVSPTAAAKLLAAVDAAPWRADLKRRVQHYGYIYDYRRRHVDAAMRLGPLPGWLAPLARRLHAEGHFPALPDQCIVNEYAPGQGIALHVDCEPCFGDVIASLSLGSACVMTFSQVDGDGKHALPLPPRSLLLMCGEARYGWQHGIPARQSDVIGGVRVARARRVSVTFRCVIET